MKRARIPCAVRRWAAATTASLLLLGALARASAADVTWQTPQPVSGDADVATNGTYVGSIAGTSPGPINGVSFANDASYTMGNIWGFGNWGFIGSNPQGLSGNYSTLLTGGTPSSGGDATLTLSNLISGHQYLVQFWVADYRGSIPADCAMTITGGANTSSQLVWADNDNTAWGGVHGSYIIGTFTADADSQAFTFSPNYAGGIQLNAMQVRDLTAAVQTWNVYYNGNGNDGGSVPVDANNPYTNGATVTVLGNAGALTKAGSVFTNWNTKADGTGISYAQGNTFVVTNTVTLFAQWAYVPAAWDPATNLTGDTDVTTIGTPVYAYTENTMSVTVNGVTFDAGNSTTSLGGGNVTLSGFSGLATVFNNGHFGGDYGNLIDAGAYGNPGLGTVTLNNLTSGRKYLVQIWVADYRPLGNVRTEVLDGQATLHYMESSGRGQCASGTFTASGTSQLIKLLANDSLQFNAIQVRDVTDVVVTWTLSYNGNGATGGSIPVDGNNPYTNGATVTVLGNPGGLTKPYVTFSNWNTAANGSGTTYNPGDTFTITTNVTLYAQWTGQTLTLINPVSATAVRADGGSFANESGDPNSFLNDTGLSFALSHTVNSAALPVMNDPSASSWTATWYNIPQNVNFTFHLGLTTNVSGILLGNQYDPVYGTYYRGVTNFTLQVSSDNGGTWTTVGPVSPALADASGQLQLIDLGTNLAYINAIRFQGATSANGSLSYGYIALGKVRFIAGDYVAPPARTLVYNGNGNTGGSVPVDGNSPYADGSTVTVLGNTGNLTKAGGATFAGWNTHANGSGTAYSPGSTFTISANTTLYAQWNVNPITWQTPVNLAGDSDIATDGTLVYAYTESDTNGTVNGVTFTADGSMSSLGSGNITLSGFTGGPGLGVWFTQTNPTFGSVDYSQNPVGLSVDYQNNVGGAAFGDNVAAAEVVLNNLTPGRQYLVQFWVCDYRAGNGRSETLSAGNVSGALTYAQPVSGTTSGTYVKGTFTAHSSGSQLITLLPAAVSGFASAQMNAIMVRDVTVTAPPVLSYIQSGSGASATLTFNWTGSGSLEWQTNALSQGLSTNWVAYPNGTNGVSVPVDTTKGSVFFRVKQ